MSANAMISSRFASISRGERPSSAAARSMFARPVYSGWKPEPSSSSAPTRPPTATVPRVGSMTPATILRQRRLARAVLADHAQRFAALQLEAHAVERAKGTRRAAPGEEVPDETNTTAARVDLRVVLADAVELEERRWSSFGARLQKIFEMRRQPPEHPASAEEERERGGQRHGVAPARLRDGRRAARRAGAPRASRMDWRRPTAARFRERGSAGRGSA